MKNSQVRRNAHWMVTSLLLVVAGCGGSSPTGGGNGGGGGDPVATTSVMVGNDFFSPPDILVSPGAMVTWTWAGGGDDHNVTFDSNAVDASPTQPSGQYAAPMPTAPGVYTYICTIHGRSIMNGAVTVQ